MPPPIFGPNEVDQSPNSVSLNTQPGVNNYWSDYFRNQFSNLQPVQNPYSTANQDQARTQQNQIIQDLQRAAAGDPNSLAQQQLRQGYQGAQSQQSSLGSTMRGQSAGAAQRSIAAGQQGIQRGLAGDQQMLQLQEQQAAQAMLAQLLAQQHGQDITQAQGMAQGQLGAAGLSDAMAQFYLGGGIRNDIMAGQTAADRARAQVGLDLEAQGIQAEQNRRIMEAGAGAAGALATMGGGQNNSGGFRQVDGQNSIVPYGEK